MEIIRPTYIWAYNLTKRTKTITRIILHHAAATSCTATQIHDWHKGNGWAGIGYHFFINKEGKVYEGRPVEYIGAHAGYNNDDSIGICFEGNFENETMNEKQKQAGRLLVETLRQRYAISKIQRHSDVNATACPGKNFPFDYIAYGTREVVSVENTVYTVRLPLISIGDKGADVLIAQRMLIGFGFSCGNSGADGDFGTNTYKAVRKFQTAKNLSVDGIIGRQTWHKMFNKED